MFCHILPATHLVELRSQTQTWSILGVLRAELIMFPDEEVSWSLVNHSPQNTSPHACDVAIDVYIHRYMHQGCKCTMYTTCSVMG